MGVVALPDLRTVKRLLIIRLSSIGDVTHALPVSAALGESFPNLEITWIVEDMSAEVVIGNPYLHDIIVVPRSRWKRERTEKVQVGREYLNLLRDLRRRRFDVTLDLQGRAKSGLMAYATGAPCRVGWCRLREGAEIVSKSLPHRPESLHRVEWFLDVARTFGANTGAVHFPLHLPDAARSRATVLLCESGIDANKPFAVLNAATGNQVRRWGAERYAETAVLLAQQFRIPSVLIGSAKDTGLNQEILGLALNQWPADVPFAVDLAGQTSVKELAVILDQSGLHISGDTGSAHIAAALGRPVIGLYGPTNPAHAGPYGQLQNVLAHREICRADCNERQCGFVKSEQETAHCLAAVTVADVLHKSGEILHG